MKQFAIIRICFFLLPGILLGFYLQPSTKDLWFPGILLFILFACSWYRAKHRLLPDLLFGLSCYSVFVYLGVLATAIHLPENRPQHYIHSITESSDKPVKLLTAQVAEKLKPGLYQDKYILKAKRLDGSVVSGKILLNISRTPESPDLRTGNFVLLPADLSEINSSLNPHQFDYRKYMYNLGVARQITTSPEEILLLDTGTLHATALADRFRRKIISELRKQDFHPEELAVMQALLLGQRQDISPETYSSYAAAGVIHILAISGLHVGIILLLLNYILYPLERMRRGKFIKTLLLLMILWGFAMVAGLSPSVVRAVTMFSFLAIGMQLKRRSSALNSLFISLFVLLLINPFYIFQVGFQLSYAAVLSIILIQPFIFRLWQPKNRPVLYLWGILSVTLAAQAGVLPLSLFYFHQFPGLFFISNLVILPFLGLILGMGMLVMLLAYAGALPAFLAAAYASLISLLNGFVDYIAGKEDFLLQDISFSLLMCLACYFLIFSLIFLLKKPGFRYLLITLAAVICLQLVSLYEKHSGNSEELLVFHKSRKSAIGIKQGANLSLYHNLDSAAVAQVFLKDYRTGENIQKLSENSLPDLLSVQHNLLLRIDSSGIYRISGLKPGLLLLNNSPRINLERLITENRPEAIIADGSNYRSFVQRWKATARKHKIPFHATAEKGAYVFKASEAMPESY